MSAPAAPPPPPPPPPPPVDDALESTLRLAHATALFVALIAGLLFLILSFVTVLDVAFGVPPFELGGVAYCFLSAVVNYLLWKELPAFERMAASGQFPALKERLLLWTVLGLVFFVVEGILLLFAYLKVDERVRSGIGPTLPPPPPPPGAVGGPGA